MKITDIVLDCVQIPYFKPYIPITYPGGVEKGQYILIARVKTDEGLEGIATCEAALGIWKVIAAGVEYAKEFLVGQSPFEVERLIWPLRTVARICTRPWVIENALWDLIGKAAKMPVYKLLGAHSNRVKLYASWGSNACSLEERQDNLHELVELGFKAVKVRTIYPTMKENIAVVENVRKTVGDKLEIMVDANQSQAKERTAVNNVSNFPVWSYERARDTAKELQALGCVWLEEPLYRYDYDLLARLAAEVEIPIAGGEINHGIHEFKTMLEKGCFSILQPNCTMSEGLSQIRKIAAMADSYGCLCNPHAWIPGMGVMVSAHLAASLTNCTYLEFPYDPPFFVPETFQGVLTQNFMVEQDGYLTLYDKPGFGMELDEERVEKYRLFKQ